MKVLMTGFDPFGGERINPSFEAVKLVQAPRGMVLTKKEIPTEFGTCAEILEKAIEDAKPDAVLLVGQAGGRAGVTPERVAINLMDATIADNAGFIPREQPIDPNGPAAFFSTLPVGAITEAMKKAGVPASVSNTAGTFVCNRLLYGALSFCSRNYPRTKVCFIHVPFLPEQTVSRPQQPSMALDTMVNALEAALRAIMT